MTGLAAIAESLARAAASALRAESLPDGLAPFATGALGGFPYYWRDPATLALNKLTYAWIAAGLEAGAYPVTQSLAPFTNGYIEAMADLSYGLSPADLKQLNQAAADIGAAQSAVLEKWQAAFGGLPAAQPPRQPFDLVMDSVAGTWAWPPTNLAGLVGCEDLAGLLKRAPATGQTVIPAIAIWLNAVASSRPLINLGPRSTGYLASALDAVQSPSPANGAVQTNDKMMRPGYLVGTPLQQILHGLNGLGPSVSLTMSVARVSATQCRVTLADGTVATVPTLDLLRLESAASVDLLGDMLSDKPVDVEVTLRGVTMVYFGPAVFAPGSAKGWYWKEPLIGAAAALKSDSKVSGFRFSTLKQGQVDFGKNGPFGFLTGVAISKDATVKILGLDHARLAGVRSFGTTTRAGLSMFGSPPAGVSGEASKHLVMVTRNAAGDGVELGLAPVVGGSGNSVDALDSTAYVIGVQTCYPAV